MRVFLKSWDNLYWFSLACAAIASFCAVAAWQTRIGGEQTNWASLFWFACAAAAISLVVLSVVKLMRQPSMRRRFLFAQLVFALLLLTTFGSLRVVGGFLSPAWPLRSLRPIDPLENYAEYVAGLKAWNFDDAVVLQRQDYNSWGMRDVERTISKRPRAHRIVFIGDSFLEGGLCRAAIPQICEDKLRLAELPVECINLGVSATGPMQYYYRLKNVGLKLSPDEVLLFVYAGNDFLNPCDEFRPGRDSPFQAITAEAPKPSLLGTVLPGINWLLVNRLRLSEFARGNAPVPNEAGRLAAICNLPPRQAVSKIAEHAHTYYFPEVELSQIKSILQRGGDDFWNLFSPEHPRREMLCGWWINNLLDWELMPADNIMNSPNEVPEHQVAPHVKSTASWIVAMRELCDRAGVKMTVVLCPVGIVDPEYVSFYRPFPQYYSFNYQQDTRHDALRDTLESAEMNIVDLKNVLMSVGGNYRKSDAHWNERGHEIVGEHLAGVIKNSRIDRIAVNAGASMR